jgi:hypothetical protein
MLKNPVGRSYSTSPTFPNGLNHQPSRKIEIVDPFIAPLEQRAAEHIPSSSRTSRITYPFLVFSIFLSFRSGIFAFVYVQGNRTSFFFSSGTGQA